MAFQNEYIPPVEKETSDFLKQARKILQTGYYESDDWTVDRECNRVLTRTGGGHEINDHDQDYWEYLDETGHYSFTTREVTRSLVSAGPPRTVAITRDIIRFWKSEVFKGLPDEKTIQLIKEAFLVYGRGGIVSQEKNVVSLHTLLWNGEVV